ncbi:MAG TPA: cellulase family glycosylhydrolase [Candidatus Acidoferrales bacterium]|nr:cellulase family glycosylhydrolase [Candidatus Acidoferrales bacterium]
MRSRIAAVLRIALAVALAASFATVGGAAPRSDAGAAAIAQRRAAHLHRGINLSKWFAGGSDPSAYTRDHFEAAITPRDVALIRAMGFDYVRLSVDPRPMFQEKQSDQIGSDYLAQLDAALKMLLDQGLAVDVDIYADPDFKERLATDDEFVEEYADFWRALARHWAALDPDRVFFEILNEPGGKDRYRWYGVEAKLATAIREGAPRHTIIATGAHWSDDDDLVFLEPLRDANVIYAFHFYEPHVFTHQGATWSTNYWHSLKGVPYPSTPGGMQAVMEQETDPLHRLALERYGMDRWNAARIDGEIAQVAAWASRWNVPVICNEFGVYRKNADPGARAAWISDVRSSLEKHGIAWAMWDYDGGFDVVNRQNGKAVPDPETIRALGLAVPDPVN